MNGNVQNMAKRWNQHVKELKEKQASENALLHPVSKDPKTIDRMSRQERFAADLGFSPTKPNTDLTGHDKKTNIPVKETKPIEVGMTEFPYDQDKNTSTGVESGKGYDIPFQEMNDNQVEEREYFNNMNKLPLQRMKREELKDYVGDTKEEHNYGYSNQATTEQEETKFALLSAMGIEKLAEEETTGVETPEGPIEKPVQHKELKKAPGIEGYVEPEVIPEASGKVSEAITKFYNTQKEIDEAKRLLSEKRKPLEESLKEISKPFEEDIKGKTALLNSYMNMIYEQLLKSDTQISHYEKKIFAAYQQVKFTVPNVTLAQVLAKAGTIDLKLQEEIKKIKAMLENLNTQEVLEKTLYEYPVSKQHERKIQTSLHKKAQLFDDLIVHINALENINTEFADLIAEIS
jgi:hypothetical protein